MRRLLVFLFHALVLITPFAFTSVNDELFEFNKMIFVYLTTTSIAVVWIWRMIAEKRLIYRHTLLALPLGIFFLSQVLSTLFSINLHTSIFGYYSRFHGGLLSTISYLILYFAAVSNLEKKDLLPLIKTSLLAAAGVALYAIPEHFGVSPSCVLITGEYTASCWVQDVQTRVFATFGQPNWLAAYALMMMPLTLWVWSTERSKPLQTTWQKWWPIGVLFLLTLTLYYTRSRSGVLALFGILPILAFGVSAPYLFQKIASLFPKNPLFSWFKTTRTPLAFPLIPLFVVALPLFVALFSATPFTPSLGDLWQKWTVSEKTEGNSPEESSQTEGRGVSPTITTTALEGGGTDSGEIRQIVWKGAWNVWKRYPILGSGLETFAYSYYKDRPMEHNLVSEWDFLYNKAHNEYLNTLANAGILGLGTLLLLLGTMATRFVQEWWRALRAKKYDDAFLPGALGAGVASAAITNFFGFSTVMVAVFTFVFPAFLEIWFQDAKGEEKSKALPLLQSTKKSSLKRGKNELEVNLETDWIVTIFVGIVGGFAILSITSMWNNDRLLAQAKQDIGSGNAVLGYQKLNTLTTRAPGEPTFWNEKALILAQIVAASYKEDPTVAAQILPEVIQSSDNAVRLNKVHLNYWKSRARIFLLLSLMDDKYLIDALETLQKTRELAPTDVKVVYNIGLIYESLGKIDEADQHYQMAIDMRPLYEEARQSYAKFLEANGNPQAAADQYRYVIEKLNPGDNKTREHLALLEASISAQLQDGL